MEAINRVTLQGRLGRAPCWRMLPSGAPVLHLLVATEWNITTGQSRCSLPRTEWHRVVLFSDLARQFRACLHKGDTVCLEGRLRTRSWCGAGGHTQYTTEVVAHTMQMVDRTGPRVRAVTEVLRQEDPGIAAWVAAYDRASAGAAVETAAMGRRRSGVGRILSKEAS